MKYVRVVWTHSFPDEPICLFSELDRARLEVRKIEVFRDGRRGWAGGGESSGGTELGEVPFPSLEEIASDSQFQPGEIDADEFEAEWRKRR